MYRFIAVSLLMSVVSVTAMDKKKTQRKSDENKKNVAIVISAASTISSVSQPISIPVRPIQSDFSPNAYLGFSNLGTGSFSPERPFSLRR